MILSSLAQDQTHPKVSLTYGANGQIRTGDILLGKQVLYPLSYVRIVLVLVVPTSPPREFRNLDPRVKSSLLFL